MPMSFLLSSPIIWKPANMHRCPLAENYRCMLILLVIVHPVDLGECVVILDTHRDR